MRAAISVRVSTDKQAKTGYGLEAQLQACQVYVRERGYTLVCEPFVDIITGTLGKALGGALGGFTSGKKEIIDLLRQRSRPYLFSNSLAPGIVGAAMKVLDMLSENTELRDKVMENADYFRTEMKAKGFDIPDGDAAIVPVMLYDAKLAQTFAEKMMENGVYVIGFFYPVVPKGKARIRVQISAGHEPEHIEKAIAAFTKVGKELGVIK